MDVFITHELRELNTFKIGRASLHLGAVHFWPPIPRCFRFTFDAAGAVRMARFLNLTALIPIHHEQDVWSHFKEDIASYDRAFQKAGFGRKTRWLSKGVRTQFGI
jgi:hypothetical protein